MNSIVAAEARAVIAQKGALDDNEMTGAYAGGPLPPSCKNVAEGGAACLRQDGIFTHHR